MPGWTCEYVEDLPIERFAHLCEWLEESAEAKAHGSDGPDIDFG